MTKNNDIVINFETFTKVDNMSHTVRRGNWVLNGYGQAMANGTWGACCAISDFRGPEFYDGMLTKEGPYFATEAEAAQAGLEKGVAWLNEHHPAD